MGDIRWKRRDVSVLILAILTDQKQEGTELCGIYRNYCTERKFFH